MTKIYQLAMQEDEYEYVRITRWTNCTDKKRGHSWEWITKNHPEYAEIVRQHPHLANATPIKCNKCGKVSCSM